MSATQLSTAVRIADVAFAFEDHRYRTPIKFGGVAVERATLLNVSCHVETQGRQTRTDSGRCRWETSGRFLPNTELRPDTGGNEGASRFGLHRFHRACREFGHPLDITHPLEPAFMEAANKSRETWN